MNELQTNFDEFIDGMRDCKNGVPHEHKSESYDRGYAAQYQLEQNMDAMTNEKH